MALDPVPWLIENGASHSANVARNVSFAAFGGQEGIVSPTDFQVLALGTPGAAVNVLPGTAAIQSRAANIRDEMYVGRASTATQVNISATGSGSRTDMIVLMVENPWLAEEPWADPPSNANGPYFFIRVLSNVNSAAKTVAGLGSAYTGYSAIALAKITIPANTATITQAMITDLRQLSQPHSQRTLRIFRPASQSANIPHSATFNDFPATDNAIIEVPSWATHFRFTTQIGSFTFGNTNNAQYDLAGQFRLRVAFGFSVGYYGASTYDLSQPPGAYYQKESTVIGQDNIPIPVNGRGANMTLRVQANRTSGDAGAQLFVNSATTIAHDVEFFSAAESSL